MKHSLHSCYQQMKKKGLCAVWSHHCRFICTLVIIIIYFLHKINCNVNSWCLDLRSHSQSEVKAAVSNWWREAGAAGEGGATRGSSWHFSIYPFSDESVPSFSRCPNEKKKKKRLKFQLTRSNAVSKWGEGDDSSPSSKPQRVSAALQRQSWNIII